MKHPDRFRSICRLRLIICKDCGELFQRYDASVGPVLCVLKRRQVVPKNEARPSL